MKKSRMMMAAAVAATLASGAFAQTAPGQPQGQGQFGGGMHHGPGGPGGHGGHHMDPDRMFAMADTNHDGQVSRAEFDAAIARRREMHEQRMERREQGGGLAGGQWGRGNQAQPQAGH